MALERKIALAAFALGIIIVLLALAGCGGDDDREVALAQGDPSFIID